MRFAQATRVLFGMVVIASHAVAAEPQPAATKTVPSSPLLPSASQLTQSQADRGEGTTTERSRIEASLRHGGTAYREGKKYHVIRSERGTLLLPATGDLSKAEIEAGVCENGPKDSSDASQSRMVVGAETPLSPALIAYASLMADVIVRKCSPNAPPPSVPQFSPEAGVRWKNGSKTGGEDKVYVRPDGNVGFTREAGSHQIAERILSENNLTKRDITRLS